ncbi:transcription factor EGL1-like isoform X2 [Cornus florida]|uniref:transcription factor EGL1-like isoform X2 n=1 Tax=Cornus florida TaxID=4283 RepID=UPI002897B337|nr:transcription factor EGL1-like isoform X2 [Cornus florida]
MCWKMANGMQSQEGLPENMRKQLAVAVRSVQWSYAIFWSLSSTQEGVLEWGDGYYNGDIKTRKTVQAMELKADKMGLQRSEQLRELYGSLLEGETDQQAQRPSASLSPEDLSDAEWYYLVCMSFVFNPGQGLPGRALAIGQPIWLCNAQYADSKIFSRSLLAKSASIQTVVCFPHLGGVIELGVTELVLEDPSVIQHIKTTLLEFSKLDCSEKSSSAPRNPDDDKDGMCAKVEHEILDTMALENLYSPIEDIEFDQAGLNKLDGNIQEDFTIDSPDDCSNGCEHNHQTEDSFMLEGVNGGASQVQSWHFMDDDLSNCIQGSMNSSDCISQAFVKQEKVISAPQGRNINNVHLKELQECNHTKLSSLDLGHHEDLHYKRTLSTFFKHSPLLMESLRFQSCDHKSSFRCWKKVNLVDGHRPQEQQRMLKKILFHVPLMYGGSSLKSQNEDSGEDWIRKPESDEICMKHALPEKITEDEKFLVLKSMVPSISKIDKASILGDTIEYLKELEARVGELESCVGLAKYEGTARRKNPDMVEQTSDNYENRRIDYTKKAWINKRKACDIDETGPELSNILPKDGPQLDMKVSIKEQEVLIEMRCPSREYLLLDIMDVINNLNLDAHSVQSSNVDGILTLTVQSKPIPS